jgi:hypothetical protein
VTDETLTSFKELQTKYQLLLAENQLLKAELDALKPGRSVTELQLQEEPCLSREPEQIVHHPATESPSTNFSNRSASAEKINFRFLDPARNRLGTLRQCVDHFRPCFRVAEFLLV